MYDGVGIQPSLGTSRARGLSAKNVQNAQVSAFADLREIFIVIDIKESHALAIGCPNGVSLRLIRGRIIAKFIDQ